MRQYSDICPICGMKADIEVPPVEHHKMYYHFCSDQCRETFIVRPSLYRVKSASERGEVIKQRTMNLAEPLGKAGVDLLTSVLMALMGVKDVLIKENKISITYDLLQVTEKQIETVLFDIGLKLGGSWLAHFRRGWIHDSEDNELDNLAAPPARSYNHTPSKM